mgnify:CR=1 FL=1
MTEELKSLKKMIKQAKRVYIAVASKHDCEYLQITKAVAYGLGQDYAELYCRINEDDGFLYIN